MNASKSLISKLSAGALILVAVLILANLGLAQKGPDPVMCCVKGKVIQTATIGACLEDGGFGLMGGNFHVGDPCGGAPSCWCVIKGKVVSTTMVNCRKSGGKCYDSKSQAIEASEIKAR